MQPSNTPAPVVATGISAGLGGRSGGVSSVATNDPTLIAPAPGASTTVRTTPAPRVDPSAIGTAPSTDSSNPDNATTFSDYETDSNLTPDEVSKISDQYTQQLQGENALIEAQYAKLTTAQQQTNDAQVARTRVLNSNSGNTDSGTGAAALTTEQKKGNDALAALDDQKNAKMASALGSIDSMEEAAIDKATSAKQADVKAYNDTLAANKKTAMDSAATLAQSGTSIDAFKADKGADGSSTYDKAVKASGLTPLEFDAYYNAQQTAANKVSYTYKIVGDTVFAYGTDPKTNKITTTEQTVPGIGDTADGSWSIKETTDGSLYKINAKTGAVLPITAKTPGNGADGTDPANGTDTDTSKPQTDFTMTKSNRNDFAKYGVSSDFIDKIQSDIRTYGLDSVLSSQTNASTTAIIKKVLGSGSAAASSGSSSGTA